MSMPAHRRHRLLRHAARFAPGAGLRRWLLARVPGIEIAPDVRIGFGTLIASDRAVLAAGVVLGRFNRVTGPFAFHVGRGTQIGARNRFACDDWVLEAEFAEQGYARRIVFGERCLVTDGHLFDVAGEIGFGDGTWAAGEGSQFWTHGVGITDRDIMIGAHCYLGSAVRVAPGARLGAGSVLALGSVLSRDLSGAVDMLVGGVPAAEIKSLVADYASGRLQRHGTAA